MRSLVHEEDYDECPICGALGDWLLGFNIGDGLTRDAGKDFWEYRRAVNAGTGGKTNETYWYLHN